MAAKIKLGSTPKSFKKVVKFPMLDGTEGSIECTYKYRTRTDFGLFIDEIVEAAKLKPAPVVDGEDAAFSMAELMEKTAGSNADSIMQVLDDWNLDEPLSKATAQQLADEIPAAAGAIMETYRVAITEGRAKN